jgi:hypothetical protein
MEVFDMYFATVVGMAIHPGYSRDNVKQLTLEECAEVASKMVAIRKQYLEGEK